MFSPEFSISPSLAKKLVLLERLATQLEHKGLSPRVIAGLRETARIHTVHYSTLIEGNRLTMAEVQTVIGDDLPIVGRERDEGEVRGYFAALNQVMTWVDEGKAITEQRLQRLHALVMAEGRSTNKYTPYRNVQNVIRDARSGTITYMPPEAKDVPPLMRELVNWLGDDDALDLPVPLIAGLLHYQYVTIHPYIDGNGRTARLLTTWQLHLSGYGLGGVYSLEEHYAKNLSAYYAALALGPSHNYFFGRVDADLTPWLEYFVDGMLKSMSAVSDAVATAGDAADDGMVAKSIYLDQRKRTALAKWGTGQFLRSTDLAKLFGIGERASRNLAHKWVTDGFLNIEDPSRKARLYRIVFDSEKAGEVADK